MSARQEKSSHPAVYLRGWSHRGRKKQVDFPFFSRKVKSPVRLEASERANWEHNKCKEAEKRTQNPRLASRLYAGFLGFREFLKDMGESLILIQHGRLQLIFQSH